ncbi:hypothetical protein [Actinoplanes friuliensis]|nr:hypothetical protein [Actinoplanes friuliensis]
MERGEDITPATFLVAWRKRTQVQLAIRSRISRARARLTELLANEGPR